MLLGSWPQSLVKHFSCRSLVKNISLLTRSLVLGAFHIHSNFWIIETQFSSPLPSLSPEVTLIDLSSEVQAIMTALMF